MDFNSGYWLTRLLMQRVLGFHGNLAVPLGDLSFVNISQTFYGFGWKTILLESGFLAIFLGGANTEPKAVP